MGDTVPLHQQKWRDSINQCKSTMFCKVYAHSRARTGADGGYYTEVYRSTGMGKGYHIRKYFNGQMEYCDNPNCEYRKFYGDKEPYRTTRIEKGVESEHTIEQP